MDFIEKLTEDSATHLMLTPHVDPRTGVMGLVSDLEQAMEMARTYFSVQDTKRRVFAAEEIDANREARFGSGGLRQQGGGSGDRRLQPGRAGTCDDCGGVGHLRRGCPNNKRKGGPDKSKECAICLGRGHSAVKIPIGF